MRLRDDLAISEREKYERVWEIPNYRRYSPGEHLVDHAIETLGMKPGESIIDYGCGTGRAATKFKDLGFQVRGIDHAKNCLDPGVDIPLETSCLWNLPILCSDWGFCTDVMEHLPSEKVFAVFFGIRTRSEKGAYFQICTHEDVWNGETLHLTVRHNEWWIERAKEHWSEVVFTDSEAVSQRSRRAILSCKT